MYDQKTCRILEIQGNYALCQFDDDTLPPLCRQVNICTSHLSHPLTKQERTALNFWALLAGVL
jgi:hypothetical protein